AHRVISDLGRRHLSLLQFFEDPFHRCALLVNREAIHTMVRKINSRSLGESCLLLSLFDLSEMIVDRGGVLRNGKLEDLRRRKTGAT
ncbi:MAG TPA: hypothetical protein VGD41_18330, partial [Pyrinomonadaceae bacterium]